MRAWPAAVFLVGAACVGSLDQPSNVHDLRVLAISMEPPEIFSQVPCQQLLGALQGIQSGHAPDAGLLLQLIGDYAKPVTFRALIADPKGNGRPIAYDINACASLSDPTCSDFSERVTLNQGTTQAVNGVDTELVVPNLKPGFTPSPDGGFLLIDVIEQDPQHGLAGFLMPLSLHLKAAAVPDGGTDQDEEIYAEKFMSYWCPFFPDMTPDQTPHLRGFTLDGDPWPEDGGILTRDGGGPFHLLADDISDLEQSYAVPDYSLQEVHLKESWIIDYYTTVGTFSPASTGGVDIGGNTDPHSTGWTPGAGATAQDVTFWFVVRDGRGGISWTRRVLNYIPL